MEIDIQIAESLIEAFDHEETGILLWDKNDKLLGSTSPTRLVKKAMVLTDLPK